MWDAGTWPGPPRCSSARGWPRDMELLREGLCSHAAPRPSPGMGWDRSVEGERRAGARGSSRGHGRVFGATCVLPVCQERWFSPTQLVLCFDIGATGLATWPCEAERKLSG